MTPNLEALRWILIYFIYGLAFFCMGFAIFLEGGRASDSRLRHALRPLAAFGMWHAAHEWMVMLDYTGRPPVSRRIIALGLALISLGLRYLRFLDPD